MKAMKTKDMTLIAVMAALICVAGPLSIPVGPIPLSLATFAVYLAGSVLGRKKGTIAVTLYLVIGVIGVPVFSGFSGGFQKLAGVTGGYLIGYLPCAYLSGVGAEKREKAGWWFHPLMMVAGTVLLYLVGTIVFMLHRTTATKTTPVTAIAGIQAFHSFFPFSRNRRVGHQYPGNIHW